MSGITSPFGFWFLGSFTPPEQRGAFVVSNGEAYALQSLPTDPQGVFTLTLTNLVVGSAVQIESTSGVPLINRTAAADTEVFSLSAYAPGSPLNNLRIKVRKGSGSPYFQPYETLATATPGSASIYVSQIPDE